MNYILNDIRLYISNLGQDECIANLKEILELMIGENQKLYDKIESLETKLSDYALYQHNLNIQDRMIKEDDK